MGVVAYCLDGKTTGDSWNRIFLIFKIIMKLSLFPFSQRTDELFFEQLYERNILLLFDSHRPHVHQFKYFLSYLFLRHAPVLLIQFPVLLNHKLQLFLIDLRP